MHSQADAEVGYLVFAREPGGEDLALDAARAEAAGDEDARQTGQATLDGVGGEGLGIDAVDLELDVIVDGGVAQGFVDALIGVLKIDVFADDADAELAVDGIHAGDEIGPVLILTGVAREAEAFDQCLVDTLFVIELGDAVDIVGVLGGEDHFGETLAEEAILERLSSSTGVSQRHRSMSG